MINKIILFLIVAAFIFPALAGTEDLADKFFERAKEVEKGIKKDAEKVKDTAEKGYKEIKKDSKEEKKDTKEVKKEKGSGKSALKKMGDSINKGWKKFLKAIGLEK